MEMTVKVVPDLSAFRAATPEEICEAIAADLYPPTNLLYVDLMAVIEAVAERFTVIPKS